MAAIEPRDTGGRTIEPSSRYIAPARDPIAPRGVGASDGGNSGGDVVSRFLAPVRQALSPRQIGGRGIVPWTDLGPTINIPNVVPGTGMGGGVGASPADPNATGPYRYYPGDDAFSVLADLFTRTFGADNPQQGTTQYGVVPTEVGGGGGGSNAILMLMIVGLAGVGIWYFYFRKKGGET